MLDAGVVIEKLKFEIRDLCDRCDILTKEKAEKDVVEKRIKEVEQTVAFLSNDVRYFMRSMNEI